MANDPLTTLDERLKQLIQTLYLIQTCVHGYIGPETQQELVRQITILGPQLSSLTQAPLDAPNSLPSVPPEIIGYVDSGRNPDIYTREFVELVQRGNAYVKGKSEALASFRDALAEEMVRELDGMEGLVALATGKGQEVGQGTGTGTGAGVGVGVGQSNGDGRVNGA